MTTDCLAIVSGGLDSVTLLHELIKQRGLNPAVLTFRYGQKHDREIACAEVQARMLGCDEHVILDLSLLATLFSTSALVAPDIPVPDIETAAGDPQPATYVPNRNMIFLALAAAFAESRSLAEVYYGAQRHDMYGYWDTTAEFLDRLNQVYQLNRRTPVRILAPFVAQSKADILRTGLALGVDYAQTWSCYQGQELACGHCPTCAERLKAFAEVGLPDPIAYADQSN